MCDDEDFLNDLFNRVQGLFALWAGHGELLGKKIKYSLLAGARAPKLRYCYTQECLCIPSGSKGGCKEPSVGKLNATNVEGWNYTDSKYVHSKTKPVSFKPSEEP